MSASTAIERKTGFCLANAFVSNASNSPDFASRTKFVPPTKTTVSFSPSVNFPPGKGVVTGGTTESGAKRFNGGGGTAWAKVARETRRSESRRFMDW